MWGRAITTGVRSELALLRRILAEVANRRSTFYLVEPEPDEEIA
jgi:hypothetical protein